MPRSEQKYDKNRNDETLTFDERTFDTHGNHCFSCNAVFDFASKAIGDEGGPDPGTINICAYCGILGQFDEDGKVVPLTDEEYADLPADLLQQIAAQQRLLEIAFRGIKPRKAGDKPNGKTHA